MNNVFISGRVGKTPELRYTTGNKTPVVNLPVATHTRFTDKETGEKKQTTEWHRVVIFGPIAEASAQYLSKGSKVTVQGRLKTREWTDKNGVVHYTTEIHAREIDFGEAPKPKQDELPMEEKATAVEDAPPNF